MKAALLTLLLIAVSTSSFADWETTESVDAMTSKRTTFATLNSNNSMSLGFPYQGRNNGRLMVRQHPQHGLNVVFSVDKGQLLCNSYSGCEVMVRFDEQPAIKFGGDGPADNSSESIFLRNPNRFIAGAAKAKKILVQVNVYQNGLQVMEFSSSKPLEWKPKK